MSRHIADRVIPVSDLCAEHVPSKNGIEVGRAARFLLPAVVVFWGVLILVVHVAVSGRI